MQLLKKLMGMLKDEKGSAFIENALWIVIVVLIVAVAGYGLATGGIEPALGTIEGKMGEAGGIAESLNFE